jgi:hypothetical protein
LRRPASPQLRQPSENRVRGYKSHKTNCPAFRNSSPGPHQGPPFPIDRQSEETRNANADAQEKT